MPQNYEQPIEPLPVRYGWSGGEGCRALMLSLQPSPRVQQPQAPSFKSFVAVSALWVGIDCFIGDWWLSQPSATL